MDISILNKMPDALLPWYRINHRELPWRRDRKPYRIWVSEIMLQQTRVEAVKGYYERFVTKLPDVFALAECDDDQLYKLWEGLGYYSRVRNMKKAAQRIVEQYGGSFPVSYEKILALPGIGEYTAGAICSIAYDQPIAAVDGNVLRVVTRLTDDATSIDNPAFKKEVKHALESVYPPEAGFFTQAIMELGATVCGPNKAPDCNRCPCQSFCLGSQRQTAGQLPVKPPKKDKKTEKKTVLVLSTGNRFALCKRSQKGLLTGLWQLPNFESKMDLEAVLAVLEGQGIVVSEVYKSVERNHIFTHIKWDMIGYYLEVKEPAGEYLWLTEEQINAEAALPTAFRKFWDLRNQ